VENIGLRTLWKIQDCAHCGKYGTVHTTVNTGLRTLWKIQDCAQYFLNGLHVIQLSLFTTTKLLNRRDTESSNYRRHIAIILLLFKSIHLHWNDPF
jgi:hypothetical protein